MRCPFCHNPDSRVIDSREADEGATTRRRRACPGCGRRFTTVEEAVLAVVKRSGVSEPFNRAKVVAGVRRACQGRPVDEDQLQKLAQQVEDAIRATGAAEVPSHEVGLAILRPLRELAPAIDAENLGPPASIFRRSRAEDAVDKPSGGTGLFGRDMRSTVWGLSCCCEHLLPAWPA